MVRGFIQRLESGAWGPVPARLGDDLRSLEEGAATAVLKQGTASGAGCARDRGAPPRRIGDATAGPTRAGHAADASDTRAHRLGLSRHGLGARARSRGDAAARAAVRSSRPGDLVAGSRPPSPGRCAPSSRSSRATHGSSSSSRERARSRSSRACSAASRPATGWSAARPIEAGRDSGGVVELVPPGSGAVPGGPRTRANVVLPPLPRRRRAIPTSLPRLVSSRRPSTSVNAPFSAADAERAVVDAAVDVLKLRGEPVSFSGPARRDPGRARPRGPPATARRGRPHLRSRQGMLAPIRMPSSWIWARPSRTTTERDRRSRPSRTTSIVSWRSSAAP